MDGYGPSTYGDRFADVYDDWYGDVSDVDATVERVAALAGAAGAPVLELGGGSGRLAVPLAARGLERGRSTPRSPCSTAAGQAGRRPGPRRGRRHGGAALVGPSPVRRRAVRLQHPLQPHRRPKPSGAAWPTPPSCSAPRTGGWWSRRSCASRATRAPRPAAVEPRHIGLDEVVLTVSRLDPATQTITGQHVQITEAGIRLRPWVLRYASPDELDALAAEAGLRLVERHAGWRGEPFTRDVGHPRLHVRADARG